MAMSDSRMYDDRTSAFALRVRLTEERISYTRENVRALPKNRIGLYAIWLPSEYVVDDWDCVYVGKSEACVRRRLLDHLRLSERNYGLRRLLYIFGSAIAFSVAYTATAGETDALETAVIRAWQPEANLAKLAAGE